MGHKGGCDPTATASGGGDRAWGRVKRKEEARNLSLALSVYLPLIALIHLTKLTKNQEFPLWSRSLPSEPSSVTVIKDCANRYFLSFVVEVEPIQSEAKSPSIGIDLGIKTFAVMSKGEKAESPSYKKLDRKVRKLQRKLARQPKDSKRRNVTRNQV